MPEKRPSKKTTPLDKQLAQSGKEELIEIIKMVVKREPAMKEVIDLAMAAPKPGKPMNVSVYRRQAQRTMETESPRAIENGLKDLRDAAARLAKSGDWLNAGAIYHVALDEAVDGYDDDVHSMDRDGDICVVMDDLAKGLGKALEKSRADARMRWDWIETMVEAELADIDLGGISLAPSASEAMLKFANDAEWTRIVEWLREEAAHSRDWNRESLIGFLAEGLKQRKRADEADELIRQLGTPEQRAYLLISEGKIDEAMKVVKTLLVNAPGLVTNFADALLEAGAKKEALAIVEEQGRDHWNNKDWLAKYYRQHGSPEEAIESQRKVFLDSPAVESYKALREVSRKSRRWDAVRAEVLAELESNGKVGALIDIALHEKDVARALELLPREDRSPGWGYQDHRWEVARAAEKEHPQAAIRLYQQLAERSIEHRSRGSYQFATEHLQRAKKLAERAGARNEWDAYLAALRARYPTLRALHDELLRAHLWM
jgi:tetratricopeptide (TPR) repeat protein